MLTKAAVLWGAQQDWQVEEIDLGDPVAGRFKSNWTLAWSTSTTRKMAAQNCPSGAPNDLDSDVSSGPTGSASSLTET